jgi:CubicO group peptidase (beta-lactamase class C family)
MSRLGDTILEAVSTFRLPGVQVAWLCDGSIEQVELGTLGLDRAVPVTAETQFRLASVTKVFTATVAMQLVADGELSLDRPIGPLLPAGEVRDRLGEITLAELLSHTGGIENDHAEDGAPLGTTLAHVRALARQPLLLPPGRHFSYSNVGYVLVGHLIEAATGLTWADGVRSFLLEPLGVRGTFQASGPAGPAGPADGHVRRRDGELACVAAPLRGRGWGPASGLAVSASGLVRLMQLHITGGRAPQGYPLLPASLVEQMRTAYVSVPNPAFAGAWGLGFALNPSRTATPGADVWFGHDGDGWGTSAYVRASAERGFAVAMLANCLPAQAEWRRLLRALASSGVDVGDGAPPEVQSPPPPIDPAVAGVYEYRAGRLTVGRECGELWLGTSAQERLALRPAGPDRCVAVRDEPGGEPLVVAFLRDSAGCVQYLHVGGRIARRVPGSGARHG